MGKHDTCQNSLHSLSFTPAAATNKTSANTFQRLYKKQKLNTELTIVPTWLPVLFIHHN
jgi:hypothetical protein